MVRSPVTSSTIEERPSSQEVRTLESVLTLDLRDTVSAEPAAIATLARQGKHRTEPFDAVHARYVKVLAVEDVDVLRIESDRGVERVRIEGLGGQHAALPRELNTWLVDMALPQVREWLQEPGATIWERPGPTQRTPGLRFATWQWEPDVDGLRVVSLERVDAQGRLVDLQSKFILEGWAYPEGAWSDSATIDMRLQFSELPSSKGLWSLACVQELVAGWRADAAEVHALEESELVELCRRIANDIQAAWSWEPREEMQFRYLSAEEVRETFRPLINEWVADVQTARKEYAEHKRAGLDVSTSPRYVQETFQPLLDVDLLFESTQGFDAWAPAGPVTYFKRRRHLSRAHLEAAIVHEVFHQYQEERVFADCVFPTPGLPEDVLEGHCESLAAQFRRTRQGKPASHRAMSYDVDVWMIERVATELGLSPYEIVRKFVESLWDTGPWTAARTGQAHLGAVFFAYDPERPVVGLAMRPDADSAGRPMMVVTNERETLFAGQFSGHFLEKFEDRVTERRSVPFNLMLPAGARVRLRIDESEDWNEGAPQSMAGFFQPTWGFVEEDE